MNLKKLIIPSLLIPFFIIGCKTSKPAETTTTTTKPAVDCAGTMPVYELDIKPIFEKKCNNCHGKRAAGGYDFTIMDDIQKSVANGELLGTIKWLDHYPQMPRQMDKLDDFTIKKIECWIQNGMK